MDAFQVWSTAAGSLSLGDQSRMQPNPTQCNLMARDGARRTAHAALRAAADMLNAACSHSDQRCAERVEARVGWGYGPIPSTACMHGSGLACTACLQTCAKGRDPLAVVELLLRYSSAQRLSAPCADPSSCYMHDYLRARLGGPEVVGVEAWRRGEADETAPHCMTSVTRSCGLPPCGHSMLPRSQRQRWQHASGCGRACL